MALLIRGDDRFPAASHFPASLPNSLPKFNRRIPTRYLAKSAAARGRTLFRGLEDQLPIPLFVVLNLNSAVKSHPEPLRLA